MPEWEFKARVRALLEGQARSGTDFRAVHLSSLGRDLVIEDILAGVLSLLAKDRGQDIEGVLHPVVGEQIRDLFGEEVADPYAGVYWRIRFLLQHQYGIDV